MACAHSLPQFRCQPETYTTTVQYLLDDRWVPVTGITIMDFTLTLRNKIGNFQLKPCYQLAAVRTDNPTTPTVITAGSYTGTAGATHYQESSPSVGSHFWVRFGIAYSLTTGSAIGKADVWLDTALQQCGRNIAGGTVQIHPGMVTTTDINYFAIGGFHPAVGLDKIKAAYMVTDNESDYMEYQMVLRSATDRTQPNSWNTCEASYTNPSTSNTERNTGQLSVPAGGSITSNHWYQLGIAVRKKSGAGGNPRATINFQGAAKYA